MLGEIDESSPDIMNLKIGSIPPLSEFTVKISFLQEVPTISNSFYDLFVPSTISPRYIDKMVGKYRGLDKKKIEVSSKTEFTWNFKILLRMSNKITLNRSSTHELQTIS